MIVIMSQKFWTKHAPKLVEPADYIGVDGENFGLTNRSADSSAIATRYSHMVTMGSYTPEGRLLTILKKMKRGEEINPRRYRHEVELYLDDVSFIACVVKTFKALYSCGFDSHLNVFLILPNIIYRYLGDPIMKEMINLAGLDFRFIFNQEELKEFGYSKLSIPLGKKRLKEISDRVSVLERKYKIKYTKKKDWDDDE